MDYFHLLIRRCREAGYAFEVRPTPKHTTRYGGAIVYAKLPYIPDFFRHMQTRPEGLYILPRVYGIIMREGCNTSVPPAARDTSCEADTSVAPGQSGDVAGWGSTAT